MSSQQAARAPGKSGGGNSAVARGIALVAVFSAVTLYVSEERAHHQAPHTGTETRSLPGRQSSGAFTRQNEDLNNMLNNVRSVLETVKTETTNLQPQPQQAAVPVQPEQGWQMRQGQQQQQRQKQIADMMAASRPKAPAKSTVQTKQQPRQPQQRPSASSAAADRRSHADSLRSAGRSAPRAASGPAAQAKIAQARAASAPAKVPAAAGAAVAPAVMAPEDMVIKVEKPFDGNFILNTQARKLGEMLKQPKHLSEQGRANRAARGKMQSAARTMKWEHVGKVDISWRDAGLLPVTDEVRTRWLSNGPGTPEATCAVVGNGGGLLGMEAGAEIDKADIVLRFNGGPVRGFERFVGRKTTYRLTNTEHFAFSDVGDEIVLQHMTNSRGIGNVTKYAKAILKKRASGKFGLDPKDRVPVRIIEPEFHYLVMNIFSYGAPSNGFYGVILASELCAVTTMYGFQKVWKGTKMPYHYYNDIEPNESQFGRDTTEAVYFAKWLEKMNELALDNEHYQNWRSRNNWQHPRFVFAEERHSYLPRLDINLASVPWVKTEEQQQADSVKRVQRRSLVGLQTKLSH